MEAQSPPNEAARLEALLEYYILDTDAEAEFDDFTLLAAQLCGTPISLISLVNADRQWFKSNWELEARETSREQAFCAHALHQPTVFLVPNAAEDTRFSENPLVTGDPNIRFYAGAPLLTSEGHVLGTLCVIDYVPRSLTPAQQAGLQALSRQVVARLELRRQLREREKADRARAKSESLKNAILQSALDCIITIDQQGWVVEWNPAAERTFGFPREEAVGQDLTDLIIPPRFQDAHRRGMAHFLETGESPILHKRIEIEAIRAGGAEFPVELAITPIVLETGTLFTAYLRDISGRKQAEAALKRAHEELEGRVAQRTLELSAALQEHQNVMATVPDILFRLDTAGRLVQWNRKMETVTGLSAEQLQDLPAVELFGPDDQNTIVQAIMRAFQTGHAIVEGSLLSQDGRPTLHQFSSVPLVGPDGAVIGLTGMGRDITERKHAEAALGESETRYRGLVERSPEAIFVFSESRLVYVNAAMVRLLGAESADELIGRDNIDFIHPDSLAAVRERTGHVSAGSNNPLAQMKYLRLDGSVIDVEAVSSAISYDGKPAGQVLVRDITERKRAEESILALNAELLHAYDATIEGWSRALDLRDHETEGHSRRVTEMTLRLARVVGISEAEIVHVRRGALLHDIGKMGVPDAVLLKPGPLGDSEWEIMRRHPALAKEMLHPAEFLRPALMIPYCHHEKWDGTGYPQGLRGDDIPLAARLFALVDVWDALSSDRPYRVAWPPERVKDHLHGLAGTHFDPALVSVFLGLLDDDRSAEAHDLSLAA